MFWDSKIFKSYSKLFEKLKLQLKSHIFFFCSLSYFHSVYLRTFSLIPLPITQSIPFYNEEQIDLYDSTFSCLIDATASLWKDDYHCMSISEELGQTEVTRCSFM